MTQDDRVEYRELSSTSNVDIQQTTPVACGASSSPSITVVGNPSTTTSNTTATTDQQSPLLFDYVDQQIDEELVCPICVSPFIDPITHSSCGNTFCSECIQSIPKCPLCSEVDFKNNCTSSAKTIRNLLDKLKVKCDMCKNTVLRGELKDHREKYCPLHDAYKQVDELKLKLEEEFNQKNEQLKSEYFELNQQLKREHDQLIQQLKDEKEQSIKDAKENFIMKERELILKVKSSEEELEKRIQEFDKKVLVREKFESSNKPIHLNVGGSIITASLGTFLHNEREPDNLFKKMFTGQHPIYETPSNKFKDSVYFIDCDPIIFKHILEWLKFGDLDNELSDSTKRSLNNSCKMFQMNNLSKKLGASDGSSQKEKVKMSQFDFMNLTNLARSQKITLNLSGLDLRGLVLQNTNLEKCEIISSDFSGMNLTHAKFKGSILRGSNFSNCDLTNVDFNGCDLSECDLSNAILNNTDMSYSNLSNQDFTGFQFTNVNFSNSILDGSNFENVTLNKCSIKLHFKKNNLKDCQLIDCNFNGSTFEEIDCNVIQRLLLITSFNECTFKNCDLTLLKDLSKFKGSTFDECLFNFEQFTNKSIENIQFKNIDFNSQHLINFEFKNVQYHKCKLNSQSLIPLQYSKIVKENIIISNEIISHTNSQSTPQLLYRGSRDGFNGIDFHSKCDNQGPTLTIIKSSEPYNQIFGGFTTQNWKSPAGGEWISDGSAFLFKIDENNQFRKFNIQQDKKQQAIHTHANYLPVFGDGNDIIISNDCNLNNNSFSNFGHAYELPPSNNNDEYEYRSEKAKSYLAGSHKFKVSEIEVFKIIQ